MPSQPALLPIPLRKLLAFPLRTRRDLGQFLLISILVTGLQIAFFPLAFILDAGYSLQVARAVLLDGRSPALPLVLDWPTILRDGLRRCGLWFLFLLPGAGLGALTLLIAFLAAWQFGLTQERLPWLYALLVLGLSLATLLCLIGALLANIAALHVLLAGSFSAAFHFPAWLPILRARFAAFELVELSVFLASLLLFTAALIAILPASFLCIGPPLLFVIPALYLRLVSTAAAALIYREALSFP